MITEAHIVSEVENTYGCQWYVYIPKLFGYPNNDIEKILYERYKKQSKTVTTTSKQVKNDLFSMFLRKFQKPKVTSNSAKGWADAETMKFCVKAKLAGTPVIRPQLRPGDVVIVGFEENNMMTPVILGTLFLPDDNSPSTSFGILESLSVQSTAILPLRELVLRNSDSESTTETTELQRITGSQIAEAVQFVSKLTEANIDAKKLIDFFQNTEIDPVTGGVMQQFPDAVGVVKFIADGDVVGKVMYNENQTSVTCPAVKQKAHYVGVWPEFELTGEDIVVTAVYTPIEYTVTFKADDVVVAVERYTVEDTSIIVPLVPEKTGFTGVWETYVLDGGNKIVNAVYN